MVNHPNRGRSKYANWQPGDRVRWENEPMLWGTIANPPPDRRLWKRGWVWVLWDDNDIEHCPGHRLLTR